MEPNQIKIDQFLSEEGKINTMPAKRAPRAVVLAHMASKFEPGRKYTEKEVNHIIDQWHTFNDYFLIRRELIESGLMKRTRNGSQYWRADEASAAAAVE